MALGKLEVGLRKGCGIQAAVYIALEGQYRLLSVARREGSMPCLEAVKVELGKLGADGHDFGDI